MYVHIEGTERSYRCFSEDKPEMSLSAARKPKRLECMVSVESYRFFVVP